MKQLLAILVLISHINFSMLVPQVDEIDIVNAKGEQEDDINSFYEYINQVVLDNEDDSPEDEDDDQARYSHIVKIDYSVAPNIILVNKTGFLSADKKAYPICSTGQIPTAHLEIQSPPPDSLLVS